MNETEIQRVAAAMHELRPDWPTASVSTFIRKHLAGKPRRDVTVALSWVACESASGTPARVLEQGPWWKAAAVEGSTTAREPYDVNAVCGICDRYEHRCRANPNSGHEFVPKVAVIRAAIPRPDTTEPER